MINDFRKVVEYKYFYVGFLNFKNKFVRKGLEGNVIYYILK